jgi:hypothetical protein
MTFTQVLAFLDRYPDDHPSNWKLSLIPGTLNVCRVVERSTTVEGLRDSICRWIQRVDPTDRLKLAAEEGDDGVYNLSPHLLRAWLGPVPVVLPDGCGINTDTGAREHLQDHLLLTDLGKNGLMIESNGTQVHYVNPAALHWLRTGNINDNGEKA